MNTERELTEEAEADRADFIREYRGGNCSCHLSLPCGSCTHPGNPLNQEDDEFYVADEPAQSDFAKSRPVRIRDW